MSIALIGLIVVQGYWIKNAIDLENEKFDKDVMEALAMTIDKIEKEETKNIFVKKREVIRRFLRALNKLSQRGLHEI